MLDKDEKHEILDIKIDHVSKQIILERILSKLTFIEDNHPQISKSPQEISLHLNILPIYTINPEFIVLAHELNGFKTILNKAFLTVPDGFGIIIGGLLSGKRFSERITGTDLVSDLTMMAFEHNLKVGFLGGKQDSAKKTLQIFTQLYPNLDAWSNQGPHISLISHQPVNNTKSKTINIKIYQNDYDLNKLLHQIASSDILFVGFGAPKQELFIEWLKSCQLSRVRNQKQYNQKMNTKNRSLIAVGVGGSFDEISGVVPKSPKIIQILGLKWLFRLVTEPWRWKRQLRLLKFITLLFKS